jgi:hypothetical protein
MPSFTGKAQMLSDNRERAEKRGAYDLGEVQGVVSDRVEDQVLQLVDDP